jgi:tRNA dimethylallyltransferase
MHTNLPHPNNPLLIVLAGPTAVGKTGLAIQLAKEFGTEIISSDSRQFYREMKIGTAVPSPEELSAVPHHFIGHLSIQEQYDVSRFETEALAKLEQLFLEHKVVIMTGGSGLYINAVCKGFDELPDRDPDLRKSFRHYLIMKELLLCRKNSKNLIRCISKKWIKTIPTVCCVPSKCVSSRASLIHS